MALSSSASSSRSASAMRRWRSAALRSSCTPCSALVARRPVQHPPGLQLHLQARVLSTSAAAEAEAEAEGERRAGQQPAGERRAARGQGGALVALKSQIVRILASLCIYKQCGKVVFVVKIPNL